MPQIERLSLSIARQESEYIHFLKQVPAAWIYATPAYLRLLENIVQSEAEIWVARNQQGEIIASLPLMWRTGPWGQVANSLPFYGSHGGVLGVDASARHDLILHYRQLTDSAASATLIGHPWPEPEEALAPSDCQDQRIGQLTQLAEPETLFSRFHYKTRNMIRKAEKSKLEVRQNPDALMELARLHAENMLAIGGQAKPKSFFTAISDCFKVGQDYRLYTAYLDGRLVSALLLLYFNGVVEYFTPVIDAEFRHLQTNSLLIWQAMQDAYLEGYKWWNWGGTWKSQNGVYQFKKRWGTDDFIYVYHTRINNQEILNAKPEELQATYPFFYVAPYNLLKGLGD